MQRIERLQVTNHERWGKLVKTWATGTNYLEDENAYPLPETVDDAIYQAAMDREIEELITASREHDGEWLIVSNEVGLGLVPPYPLGRLYRDVLGRANQQLASAADIVILMVAGIPLRVKG